MGDAPLVENRRLARQAWVSAPNGNATGLAFDYANPRIFGEGLGQAAEQQLVEAIQHDGDSLGHQKGTTECSSLASTTSSGG